jgi:hypothetical protein
MHRSEGVSVIRVLPFGNIEYILCMMYTSSRIGSVSKDLCYTDSLFTTVV